jgi:endonuclease/exonuclease/phosphatase family metal-dependent hydrolase
MCLFTGLRRETEAFFFFANRGTNKEMLKVLSYNIHKGVCYYTRKTVLDELREGIRANNPDVVFLQEVRGHSRRATVAPQFEFLAEQLWPHFAYGKNAVYTRGHHGNAILSKFPIEFHHNLDISTSRFERRGLLHAKVKIPKFGGLDLFCVHMDLLERGRKQQMEAVVSRVEATVSVKDAMILAGDFNDWRIMPRLFLRCGRLGRSIVSIFAVFI